MCGNLSGTFGAIKLLKGLPKSGRVQMHSFCRVGRCKQDPDQSCSISMWVVCEYVCVYVYVRECACWEGGTAVHSHDSGALHTEVRCDSVREQ
jgi:hypothetical protein